VSDDLYKASYVLVMIALVSMIIVIIVIMHRIYQQLKTVPPLLLTPSTPSIVASVPSSVNGDYQQLNNDDEANGLLSKKSVIAESKSEDNGKNESNVHVLLQTVDNEAQLHAVWPNGVAQLSNYVRPTQRKSLSLSLSLCFLGPTSSVGFIASLFCVLTNE
jgi:hypothetical protein